MTLADPRSISARFRFWYEHERDSNAKALRMLESVPAANRSSPPFAKAVGRLAHLVAARHMWLHRLGVRSDRPAGWFPDTNIEALPALVADVERSWTAFLAVLDDDAVFREVEFTASDGRRLRWPLIELLTQVSGHAWYHRGQIAMLVADLGGEPIDTDYIFWHRPAVVG